MATEDETQGKTEQGAEAATAATAAGEAAAPASGAAAAPGIADALKASFAEYIAEHDVVPGSGGGQLNLDWEFIRNHGGPLVAHMFSRLTRELLPENLSFSVPAPKSAPRAEGDGSAEPAAKPQGVAINFDLGDFLGKLFKPPQGGPRER